jgi:spindle assembly abnormal protein 6
LEVQLTDDSDLYFLYQLDIGEDDFHHLKTDQNLLVDFAQFPKKFIELLEECVQNKDKETPK